MEKDLSRKQKQITKIKQIKKHIQQKILESLVYLKRLKKQQVGVPKIKEQVNKQKKKKKKKVKRVMEKNSQQSIIVGYHYPCIDGVFSALNCFLSLKLYNQFNKDLMERLLSEDFEDCYFNGFNQKSKDQNDKTASEKVQSEVKEEQKQSQQEISELSEDVNQLKQRLQLHSEDLKGYLYSDSFKPMKFVPSKIQQDSTEQGNVYLKFKTVDKANSVLILLDYYGQSAENLQKFCDQYKKVIVIDHHITLISTLEQIVQNQNQLNQESTQNSEQDKNQLDDQQKESKDQNDYCIPIHLSKAIKNIFPNLNIIYNRRMSGASLTFDFFTKLFNYKDYLNDQLYEHIKEISKMVEIYDTKFEQNRRAEAFVANVISSQYELNARSNYFIFSKLVNCYIEGHVKLGEGILNSLEKQANNLVKQKFIVHIGGKYNTIAKCYAVISSNLSITNQTAHKLAELSLKDGMDNVGCFIIQDKSKSKIKVSLRSDNDPSKEQKCHIIAQSFNGGGHPSAASFFTTFSQVKSWR
ncbi:hypothetical protein TTHERM_00590300 (macronuclear) [Tetrahymena thermophila SB210]|uniref:DHH family protein n=1 Tax=Tetrahymena thermophila (strain SB210) TaxID=312017 RepID=I7MKP8_TETTS|nr:hypothetical protein TTHERM_00590300 [Tetrahymena thermophila SB210]EAR99692.2 hypothetical protein TTHERM_00590300 [Tetrahymena thermophila SB210]|eukprot:XP_001019937.2 hypothetical protein TTHERM_00590300 [Tetrahymena thermophila SB210]